jgi:ATP-binding protein involved in chromosome partitioning
MSGFVCSHGDTYDLFGTGGGDRLAADIGSHLLARIPIESAVSSGGDSGQPASLGDGAAGEAFRVLVDAVLDLEPVTEMSGCSSRILDTVRVALGARS